MWLWLWELWVAVHLLAAYCSRSMRSALSPGPDPGTLPGLGQDQLQRGWVAAVPWKLLGFHACRAVLLPVLMGFAPYWVAALALT